MDVRRGAKECLLPSLCIPIRHGRGVCQHVLTRDVVIILKELQISRSGENAISIK